LCYPRIEKGRREERPRGHTVVYPRARDAPKAKGMAPLIWVGRAFSISQSAFFASLNFAAFSVSKLRLEVEAASGNHDAQKVLRLRRHSNFLLITILWGNTGVNVLPAQLANPVLAGLAAFLLSTVLITVAGEILPQAYFSRNTLRVAALLSPILRMYQVALHPVAKPTASLPDRLLGSERVDYLTEHSLRGLITIHTRAERVDIGYLKCPGALNFLAIDDLPSAGEGEPVDPTSVFALSFRDGRPVFPAVERSCDDPFLRQVGRSGKKWVVLVDSSGAPRRVLDADGLLRDTLLATSPSDPQRYCHRPIIIGAPDARLGSVIPRLGVEPRHTEDDVVDEDIILLWGDEKRIITGADILGRLLRGIVENEGVAFAKRPPASSMRGGAGAATDHITGEGERGASRG